MDRLPRMQWTLEERAKVVMRLARGLTRMADVMAHHGLTPPTVEIWVGEFLHAARERFDDDMAARLEALGLVRDEVRTQQSGRMEEVAPLDLLQSLGIYRRSGRVLFFHAQGTSQLWFADGKIVDAQSGALRRAAAVYRIVGHDAGDFRVDVTGIPHPCHIETSSSALLFEAARRLDEAQRLADRLPPPHVVLCANPGVLMLPGMGEAHLQVAQAFGRGATVGEVLERSPLGELETRQVVTELEQAHQLRPTGALRRPDVPSVERRIAALRQAQLEISQPLVTSSLQVLVDPVLPPRRRRWGHMLASCVVAASGSLGMMLGSADDDDGEPVEAPPVVVAASPPPAPVAVAEPPPPPCPDDMVYLPAGELAAARADLSVYVGALCIDRHEVTVAQYRACAERGDCSRGHTDADWRHQGRRGLKRKRAEASRHCNAGHEGTDVHPMNCVTWEQANAYCRSQGKRLPTEAQWERAARGTAGRRFPWGDHPPTPERVNACGPECTDSVPAYAEPDSHEGTAPVGVAPQGATPEGVHEMGGNVREWTAGAIRTPGSGAEAGDHRAVRGGSFASKERTELSVEHRQAVAVGERRPDLGFRCARAPNG
ncbi:MAG: SUMF1/EgtB/PvdO family nonheme iron enzyme [Myxococcota bacterium]